VGGVQPGDWAAWVGVAVALMVGVAAWLRAGRANRIAADANEIARRGVELQEQPPDNTDVHFEKRPTGSPRLGLCNIGRSHATDVHFDFGRWTVTSGSTTREVVRTGETVPFTLADPSLSQPATVMVTVTWGPPDGRRSQIVV
jgi:hypothetical protein